MTESNNPQIVFIDTNIWIYAFVDSQDKTKTQRARALIRREQIISLSTQVINEITNNLLRKYHTSEDVIQRLVRTMYRKCQVYTFTEDLLLNASRLRTTYSLSFWDSTIVASALESGAIILYSEDMHDSLIVNNQLFIKNPLKELS
jgi:predicted nucleic acid-binding protein